MQNPCNALRSGSLSPHGGEEGSSLAFDPIERQECRAADDRIH
jgi:hypothetical protein